MQTIAGSSGQKAGFRRRLPAILFEAQWKACQTGLGSGNIGGMTWSGYAFDPQHSLLVTNTNNIVAGARLIPRVKYKQSGSHDEDGDYGDQTGAPYGMFRRFLQSPSDLPCSAPPWGLLTAVDINEGKIRWQVPLGSMQDFGGAHAQLNMGVWRREVGEYR